jgi:hypothetical protein
MKMEFGCKVTFSERWILKDNAESVGMSGTDQRAQEKIKALQKENQELQETNNLLNFKIQLLIDMVFDTWFWLNVLTHSFS